MRQLLALLKAKIAELEALQAADPTVSQAFSEAELAQLKQAKDFMQKRVDAMDEYDAKQAKKRADELNENEVKKKTKEVLNAPTDVVKMTSPDVAEINKKLKDTQNLMTTANLSQAEAEKLQKDVKELTQGLPSVKAEITDKKASAELSQTFTEDSGETHKHKLTLGQDKEKETTTVGYDIENVSADKKQTVTVGSKVDVSKDNVVANLNSSQTFVNDDGSKDKIKQEIGYDHKKGKYTVGGGYEHTAPNDKSSYGIDGKLNYSQKDGLGGDGALTLGKKNDDNSKDKTKIEAGYDAEKKKVTVGVGSDHTDPTGNKTDGFKTKLGIGKNEAEAGLGFTNSEKQTIDNKEHTDSKSTDFSLKDTAEKTNFDIVHKQSHKVDGKEKDALEIKGGLEFGKGEKEGDVTAKISGKKTFNFDILPKKEAQIPIGTTGFLDFFIHFGLFAKTKLELDFGVMYEHVAEKEKIDSKTNTTKKVEKSNDLTISTSAKAEVTVEGEIGLGMTIVKLVEARIDLYAKLVASVMAQVKGKLDDFKSFSLESLAKVKGSLEGGVRVVIGAAKWLRDIYKSLGGNPEALQYSYTIGKMNLFVFESPEYKQGEKWTIGKDNLTKSSDTEVVEKDVEKRGNFWKAIVDALEAVGKFLVNIASAIWDFIKALGKALLEVCKKAVAWFASLFSSKKRREIEEQAERDEKFKKIVEKAVQDVKKQPKLIDRINKIADEEGKKKELEKIVMEDEAIKAAYLAIFKPKEVENAEQVLKQLDADIKQFSLVAQTPLVELGKDAKFELNIESATKLDFKNAVRIEIYCDGKVVATQTPDIIIDAKSNKYTQTIKMPTADALPKDFDPAKSKITAKAVFDLLGNLKDKETETLALKLKPAQTNNTTEEPAKTEPPFEATFQIMGNSNYVLQVNKATPIKAMLLVTIPKETSLTAQELNQPNITAKIFFNGALIGTAVSKQKLQKGIKNVVHFTDLQLPNLINLRTQAFAKDTPNAEIAAALLKDKITISISALDKPIMSHQISVSVPQSE